MWNLRSSDDRAFDRQSKGTGLDTQRNGSVPFFTKNFFNKLKAVIDCEDTDFSDFVDAVAHHYALPAVRDSLIFHTTGRITAYI